MILNPFKLENYLARYEFNAPYLLCCSDAESMSMTELLNLSSAHEKRLWDDLRLGYTEASGLPLLRETLIQTLYPSLKENEILCFAGAEDGIFCALFALCEPGDHVIVLAPCYQSLLEIPKMKKASVTLLPLLEEEEWRLNLEKLKKAITPYTKGIIINFPHNPTGQVITQEELDDLVKVCETQGLWLFSDEVYRLLGHPQNSWVKPAAECYPKALSLGVMSKSFGMAGLRIDWIVCQDTELLSKIQQVKHYTSICNSAPAEVLSVIALKNKDHILERNNKVVKDNLALLEDFFHHYQDLFSWVKPQGGCVGFVCFKNPESVEAFCTRLVQEKGVLLLPESVYNDSLNHFRIGFGRKNMPQALEQLEEFLKE